MALRTIVIVLFVEFLPFLGVLIFVQADELLKLSVKAKKSFQVAIYDHAIKNEKASRQHSHLLFLDID